MTFHAFFLLDAHNNDEEHEVNSEVSKRGRSNEDYVNIRKIASYGAFASDNASDVPQQLNNSSMSSEEFLLGHENTPRLNCKAKFTISILFVLYLLSFNGLVFIIRQYIHNCYVIDYDEFSTMGEVALGILSVILGVYIARRVSSMNTGRFSVFLTMSLCLVLINLCIFLIFLIPCDYRLAIIIFLAVVILLMFLAYFYFDYTSFGNIFPNYFIPNYS